MKIVKREFECEEVFTPLYYVQIQVKEKSTGLVRLFQKQFLNRKNLTGSELKNELNKFANKYLNNLLFNSEYELIPFESAKFHFSKYGSKYYSNELLSLNDLGKAILKEKENGNN